MIHAPGLMEIDWICIHIKLFIFKSRTSYRAPAAAGEIHRLSPFRGGGKNSRTKGVRVCKREIQRRERDTHTKTQGSNRSGRKFPLGKNMRPTQRFEMEAASPRAVSLF